MRQHINVTPSLECAFLRARTSPSPSVPDSRFPQSTKSLTSPSLMGARKRQRQCALTASGSSDAFCKPKPQNGERDLTIAVAVFALGSSSSSRVHQGHWYRPGSPLTHSRLALSEGEARTESLISVQAIAYLWGQKTVGRNSQGCHTKHLLCGPHGAAVLSFRSGR